MKNLNRSFLRLSLYVKSSCVAAVNDIVSSMLSYPNLRSSKLIMALDKLLFTLRRSLGRTSEKMVVFLIKDCYARCPEVFDEAVSTALCDSQNVVSFTEERISRQRRTLYRDVT